MYSEDILQPEEHMLLWSSHDEHFSIKGPMSDIRVLDGYLDGDIERVFRIDFDASDSGRPHLEDITELIAESWLENRAIDPDKESIIGYGKWLEESRAWDDYTRAYRRQRDNYGEHRLSYRQLL